MSTPDGKKHKKHHEKQTCDKQSTACEDNKSCRQAPECDNYYDDEENADCEQDLEYYDEIICGLGAACSVLADKESRDGQKVLVLEYGVDHNYDPTNLSANPPAVFQDLTFNPLHAINNGIGGFFPYDSIVYAGGKGNGGGSSNNYEITVHGTPRVYDLWAQISGNPMWAQTNVQKIIKRIEDYTSNGTTVDYKTRGTEGPVHVWQISPPVLQTTYPLVDGLAAASNTPFIADYNDPTLGDIGISATQQFNKPPPDLRRSWWAKERLGPDAIDQKTGQGVHGRPLTVRNHCFVTRVLFARGNKKNKAIGVEYLDSRDPKKSPRLRRVYGDLIVLGMSAIRTPRCLFHSGIGPAATLKQHGIKVRVDNPNVGAHLQNQYGNIAVTTGLVDTQGFQAFIDESSTSPTISQIPHDGVRRGQVIGVSVSAAPPTPISQFIHFISRPHSRGAVILVDRNPLVDPNIDLNMYSDGPVTTADTDANLAVTFYKIVKEAATLAGQQVLYPPPTDYPITLGGLQADDSALLTDAQKLGGIQVAYHACGTTRMGKTALDSVVDGFLHVHGTENLMVVDYGVAPETQDGNTCFPSYVIGYMGHKILQQKRKHKQRKHH